MEAQPTDDQPADPLAEACAQAVEVLKATDEVALIGQAVRATGCRAGLLAKRDGVLIAAAELGGPEASEVAGGVAAALQSVERLPLGRREGPAMVHAGLGGDELMAVAGPRLLACLVGLTWSTRQMAEALLPVLLARAEELAQAPVEARPTGQEDQESRL